jgi:alcohol dehydrogenase class IV
VEVPITRWFQHPERVIFGQGVAKQVGRLAKDLQARKAFVVTGRVVSTLDAFRDIEESLKEQNIDYYVYAEADTNPTDAQVEKGARLCSGESADTLVAVGGGSCLDSAKAIGVLVNNASGSIRDYSCGDLDADPIPNQIPPLIAVPTTSGTGSEVSTAAVITDTAGNYKMDIGGLGTKALAKIALVDPVMSASMPPPLTAASGMDALSHAIEAYCSPYAMPQTDALALAAVKLIVKHLGPAVANGGDMEAREGMATGSLMAGMSMNAWCGAAHALGHQLSTQYGMPHGTAMAIMLPVVMAFNMIACVDRLVDIAAAMGEHVDGLSKMEAAEKAPHAVHRLTKSLGLPTTMSEYGADSGLIPACLEWAKKDDSMAGNPRTLTSEQVEDLYRKAFTGALD